MKKVISFSLLAFTLTANGQDITKVLEQPGVENAYPQWPNELGNSSIKIKYIDIKDDDYSDLMLG